VMAKAAKAPTAMAERTLIMTVPCHRALVALHLMGTDTQPPFPDVFAKCRKRFRPAGVLCRRRPGDETLPARREDAVTPLVVPAF
jgi:hypothetical protein